MIITCAVARPARHFQVASLLLDYDDLIWRNIFDYTDTGTTRFLIILRIRLQLCGSCQKVLVTVGQESNSVGELRKL